MADKNSKDLLKLEVNSTTVAPKSCLESKLFVCKKDSPFPLSEAPLQKPSMSPVPKSHVLGKVHDFLGIISESNKKLLQDAKDNPENYDIEVLDGKESEYIEMDLMLGVADLHTPEAIAAAESAMAGRPPLIHLAGSEDSSDEDDDNKDKEVGPQSATCGSKDEERDSSSKTSRKQKPKKRSKIVELSCPSLLCAQLFVIVNCLNTTNTNVTISIKDDPTPLPIATIFKFPSPLPTWPSGGGFATGEIDLGGLQIRQISSFQQVGSASDGGPDNLGATFFEPSSVPDGFSMLGAYAQPNNQPLFGWLNTPQNTAYFWLPTPPDGYRPVGLVVTASPDKPSLDQIRCVRSDFTDEAETDTWIWGESGLNVYALRPKTRGTNAQPISVGTFIVQTDQNSTIYLSILKNINTAFTSAPNLNQIEALFETYSPWIYFHPDEKYYPSPVNWFFANGALLYTRGDESNPVSIQPDGSNLPQGGSNDGAYWLDLPVDGQGKDNVAKGDMQTAEVYLHVKPVLGSTFTDIQVWVFYPYNGHAVAKLGFIKRISLGRIGEHVGDWEHVTLRISNFDGTLYRVFYAEHNGGNWVDSSLLEYVYANKFVVYASLNGHASYYRAGLVLLGGGKDGVGIRDDTWKGLLMDSGAGFTVVEADGLSVVAPPWLGYKREWGPKLTFEFWKEVEKVERFLIGPLRKKFRKLINNLPSELYGEEGPTGPNDKTNWDGDEN
ncbi:hypothetical protein PHJA_001399200 [Phtheirospermum japonicum]|uniref:Vacuolar protein sorting-associated protein 62 n=1 Tax=Phtheirospermum japonicum TaxID=374723 RepID=A0A830BYK3_9LAMI|nr:hypothetical protein PHJA_001399200 [Phtheirospermum japonicum]